MRGAGKDSTSGRDLLYRYYGQLELLDLRFPVEERGVRVGFTWYDAFTLKPTSQYSLAFEKASIIFNISAVHSCHATNQNRSEELGIKTAFNSFQAAAGMFTYINENFLHAPSTDLSRDTVKTLINIMLAQAQEVFLEKLIADGKKSGMLAKLAAQAGFLYAQAVEGVQENVQKGIFERVWLLLCQVKQNFMDSLAQYLQALADSEGSKYGLAIARLHLAEDLAKESLRTSQAFPNSPPATSNLSSETGPALVQINKRHLALVQGKLVALIKDNDFIYHQTVPAETAIPVVQKTVAARAIPVQELYQGDDISRIIGPDIFQKIVPMKVTESASLYDEEKAKLVRAETERADVANAEMVAALDYLKLPGSLKLLKNGFENEIEVDDEFRTWCDDIAHKPETLEERFSGLKRDKKRIVEILDRSSKSLDTEESVCEKMRAKYLDEWTQQPSGRLTQTLRADIRSYREAVDEAVNSDNLLFSQYRGVEVEIKDMKNAGERAEEGAVDRLWVGKAGVANGGFSGDRGGETLLDVDEGDSGVTVLEQIERVEELLKKLNLIKRERAQVLKDLKERVHTDDISNVLILNQKSIQNLEPQLFATELEKFRPHTNRLLTAAHKQSSLMKDLTSAYGDLLQDKRIRAEQSKYEALSRQRNAVLGKFKKTYQAFLDIWAGLEKAQQFYTEMTETAESLEKNVETFVSNRRVEGASLLGHIEQRGGSEADTQRGKLIGMMEKVSIGSGDVGQMQQKRPAPLPNVNTHQSQPSAASVHGQSPPGTPRYAPHPYSNYHPTPTPPPPPPPPPPPTSAGLAGYSQYTGNSANGYGRRDSYGQAQQGGSAPRRDSYQSASMQRRESHQTLPSSPSPTGSQQQHQPYQPSHYSSPPNMYAGQVPGYPQQYNPSTYIPPPPPPGPPPPPSLSNRQSFGMLPQTSYQQPPHPTTPGLPPQGYHQYPAPQGQQQQQQQQQLQDPWAGLAGWK
ncbi:BRO1-domain-containing protein [Tuber magnatum]|uniref:BRO domain-containing protein 1 n=1 Tax=Tuber magnatum TaxID=42249 RepID=A0A317SG19_9PEZI|nr:BRO1-domain-containing protein [Tuber magnatum]